MSDTTNTKEQLEIYKLNSEELRHTSTVIWQFSIAIVTLQAGAIALMAQSAFQNWLGKVVLAIAFFLASCFSLMLVRQATERRGFKERLQKVEEDLGFKPIQTCCKWFSSIVLARILLAESICGLILFIAFAPSTSNELKPNKNAIVIQIAPGQTIQYPVEGDKNYTIELEGGKVRFSATK